MRSNRKAFAAKLSPLLIKREPYIDAANEYINDEMSLFIRSIVESAQLPLLTIQNFIQAENSINKTSLIVTMILELYGLKFYFQCTESSDHVVVARVSDYLLPLASKSLQQNISRRGELFKGEDFNEIVLLYKIFSTNLLSAFTFIDYYTLDSAIIIDPDLKDSPHTEAARAHVSNSGSDAEKDANACYKFSLSSRTS